jgi:hypothetical protein
MAPLEAARQPSLKLLPVFHEREIVSATISPTSFCWVTE